MPGTPVLIEIIAKFGEQVILADGSLNRKRLGEIVFNDPDKRKDLEAILHPKIRQVMWERLREAEQKEPETLIIMDIPLLYESGQQSHFNEVMVVYVSERVQLERLMARDHLSYEAAEKRLKLQMPIELKKQLADIVIDNEGSLMNTEQQIALFWQRKGLK